MVRGYNRVVALGNLTRDVEVRYTSSNRARASFTLAVNRTWKDRDGNVHEAADFLPVVVWGSQAENCHKYLAKGRAALVEGRIQTRSYEAQDGSRRYVTEINADQVLFMGGGRQEDQGPTEHFRAKADGYAPEPPAPLDVSERADESDQSDIPF